MCLGAYWRHISDRELRLTRYSADLSGHGGTTVAIFILSQLQELLLNSNVPFYTTFINIEKDSRYMYVVCLLLNQQVAGETDAQHDQGHEKQDNNWQL